MKYIERNEADENKLELKELMNLSEDNNKSEIFSQNYENVNNVVNYNFDTYNSLTPNWYYKVLR